MQTYTCLIGTSGSKVSMITSSPIHGSRLESFGEVAGTIFIRILLVVSISVMDGRALRAVNSEIIYIFTQMKYVAFSQPLIKTIKTTVVTIYNSVVTAFD